MGACTSRANTRATPFPVIWKARSNRGYASRSRLLGAIRSLASVHARVRFHPDRSRSGLKERCMPTTAGAAAQPLSSRGKHLVGAELERCIFCRGTKITREGKRYKKLETVQLWYCRTCDRVFTPQRAKGKRYPLKIILESLIYYYRGETRERTAEHIRERFGISVPARTLSAWLAEYRNLTPYARYRSANLAHHRPNRIIQS